MNDKENIKICFRMRARLDNWDKKFVNEMATNIRKNRILSPGQSEQLQKIIFKATEEKRSNKK